jgi:hypothetical protein
MVMSNAESWVGYDTRPSSLAAAEIAAILVFGIWYENFLAGLLDRVSRNRRETRAPCIILLAAFKPLSLRSRLLLGTRIRK